MIKRVVICLAALTLTAGFGAGLERVEIAGATSVTPFAEVVQKILHDDILVTLNQRGSTRGLRQLCEKASVPTVVLSSHRVTAETLDRCRVHGFDWLREIKVARYGLVLAQNASTSPLELTTRDLFLALGARTPLSDQDCTLLTNNRTSWSAVRSSLPARPILMIGPAQGTDRFNDFVDLALRDGARSFPCLATLEVKAPQIFDRAVKVRNDQHWVVAGDDEGAVAGVLRHLPHGLALFGWSSLIGTDELAILPLNGVHPTTSTIADRTYPLTQDFYLYTAEAHLGEESAVRRVVEPFVNLGETSPGGRLFEIGFVPPRDSELSYLVNVASGERSAALSP
ncbi:phosphate binding protein, putative [Parvularcula bermudensis HTCC2503]|uniref:Phosphate binding protein, putative n=1 Tax=Parvularcula bermudensis (strain ATCC BAA-594 / HTCC2503 / KCTC 12087) TaxID=314260 RepID=E0TBZ6_PARBH|nr:substrate-binding domain-containing protein [Parvularcula bermudensis]ADM08489.1 phosphate binding protein, putative [Parvularcula bermudensis HTCC2503]